MLKIEAVFKSFSILLSLLLFSACTIQPASTPSATRPVTLTVLAAASLTESFRDLGQQFEALQPGVYVEFNFAGSQQLAQQIENGAPVDVFASADQLQMDAAITALRVDSAAVRLFTRNRLVVIHPNEQDHLVRSLSDLSRPGVTLVLASKEVPVGQYSLDFFANAASDPVFGTAYQTAVLANVVSYENNVKGVLTKVALGEADAGIVYASDAASSAMEKVGQISIPDSLNITAQYPIASLTDTHQPELAEAFIAFVLSPAGQQTLKRYGFLPIE